MVLFIIGNLMSALAPSYEVMMGGRIVAALCHGAFFGIDLSEPLIPIPGSLPDLGVALDGCRFAERCTFARDVCRGRAPALSPRGAHHLARCHATEKGGWL